MAALAGRGVVTMSEATVQATTVHEAQAANGRRRRAYGRGGRSRAASFWLHAGLVLATVIAIFPVVWILFASFKPGYAQLSSEIQLIRDPTLENYRFVLFDTNFPRWFLNSVVVASFTMLFGIFMAATAGFAVSRYNFPGRRGIMWMLLVTQMFPVAVLIVPIYTIMANLGLINTPVSLIIAYCTVAVPFCAWLLKGYFDTIPRDLDEAAALDGLGPFGVFWRVVLPLARPGLAVTAFFTFLTAWGEVAYASSFIQSDRNFTLAYGLQQFVPRFNPQWEYLTAAAIIVTIPAGIVFLLIQRNLVSGLTVGGVKG
jgi:arabinogalactan oligomer / maltooligosaccharide transport system permease protein